MALSAKLHQMACLAVKTASRLIQAVPEFRGYNLHRSEALRIQMTAEERKKKNNGEQGDVYRQGHEWQVKTL